MQLVVNHNSTFLCVRNLPFMQDTLDAWIACQAAWQYLEPIFSSPDIMAQMPEAGEKFGMVDTSWRDIMDAAAADPSALSAGKSRERLDTLNEANQFLDDIQKSTFLMLILLLVLFCSTIWTGYSHRGKCRVGFRVSVACLYYAIQLHLMSVELQ